MNGFLVVLSHSMDDFPIRLCSAREHAVMVAKATSWDLTDEQMNAFGRDASSPCVIAIVEFKDGLPQGWDVIRNCDEEDEESAA